MEIRSISNLSVPKDGEEKIPAIHGNGAKHSTLKQKDAGKLKKSVPEHF